MNNQNETQSKTKIDPKQTEQIKQEAKQAEIKDAAVAIADHAESGRTYPFTCW